MADAVDYLKRLAGSGNRINWSEADLKRIADRCGTRVGDAAAMPPVWDVSVSKGVAEADSKQFTFTISTPAVDRMGDTIAIDGWRLDAYRRNPVVLWGHQAGTLPIGRTERIFVQGAKLKGTMRFAPGHAAAKVRAFVEHGTVKATSVGFRPIKWSFSDDPKRKLGIDFKEQELLEWSIVTIPANAEALIDAHQPSKDAQRRLRDLELIRIRSF